MGDKFTLYNLKVEVVASDKPMVCRHREVTTFSGRRGYNLSGEQLLFHVCPQCNFALASCKTAAVASK